MESPSNVTLDLYHTCLALFERFYAGKTVRKISVSLSNIQDDTNMQLDLFRPDQEKKRQLGYVMDGIRERYGSTALLWAVSYTNAGDGLFAVKIGRRPSGIERRMIYASRQRQYQMGFHDAA